MRKPPERYKCDWFMLSVGIVMLLIGLPVMIPVLSGAVGWGSHQGAATFQCLGTALVLFYCGRPRRVP